MGKVNEQDITLLSNKIKQLYDERKTVKDAEDQANANKDSVEIHKKTIESRAVFSKFEHFYLSIMNIIPQDKKTALHESFKEAYKNSIGEKKYQTSLLVVENDDSVLTTREKKDHFLLYKCNAFIIENGLYEEFLKMAAQEIDREQLNKVIQEIDDYRSPYLNNLPVYFFKDKIEGIKKDNETKVNDPEQLKELNDELDLVANTVVTSTEEYSRNQDSFDGIYESIRIERDTELIENALKKEEYKHYDEYFEKNNVKAFNCVKRLKAQFFGDPQLFKDITNDSVKFEVPKKTKEGLKEIVSFMKERGMIQKEFSGRESGSKAYGFRQIFFAHQELDKAIETTDVNRIKQARENYEQALQNMREVYKKIEEYFGATQDMMVGNINCYREDWVPNEFKNNMVLNSLASGIYNFALTMENTNISIDEFLDNVNESALKIMSDNVKAQTPNELLKNNSIARNMVDALRKDIDVTYSPLIVGRNIELISQLSINSPNKERNIMASMLLQSYDAYIDNSARSIEQSSAPEYLHEKKELTLSNIFLVNEKDRDYDKLRAFDSYTLNGEKKIPAFDTSEYLHNHKIDPDNLILRIQSTIAEAMEIERDFVRGNDIAQIIRGAQMAAYQYIMVHTTPDVGYDKKSYDKLKAMVFEPNKAFREALNFKKVKTAFDKLPSMKEIATQIERTGKTTINTLRQKAREEEARYNQSATLLTQTIQNLQEQINENEGVEQAQNQLKTAQEQLKQLKEAEINRLNNAYCNGELTKDYFENRKENIKNNEFEKTVSFGVADYPKFSKFKEKYAHELKEGELTKKDVEFFYERMMEEARIEENKLILISAGIQQKPKLENQEEVAIEVAENQPERIVIEELKEDIGEQLSERIQEEDLQSSKVKQPQKID